MIKINGEMVEYDEIPLLTYLKEAGYNPAIIAVEVNEIIVPKATYSECILHSGDVVEIVHFMGGGSHVK